MKLRLASTFYPAVLIVISLIINPLKIIASSNSWHTQIVLYKSRYSDNKQVEFQMLDIGAMGYNRRTVVVSYFSPLFMLTTRQIPTNIDNNDEWEKVDFFKNELGLKPI